MEIADKDSEQGYKHRFVRDGGERSKSLKNRDIQTGNTTSVTRSKSRRTNSHDFQQNSFVTNSAAYFNESSSMVSSLHFTHGYNERLRFDAYNFSSS